MYCRNCGSELNEQAVICVKCGVSRNTGTKFCQNCGKPTIAEAIICTSCGVPLANVAMPRSAPPRSAPAAGAVGQPGAKTRTTAGILAILLGGFGAHNFYLGNTKKAFIQLGITGVGFLLAIFGIGIFLIIGASIWGVVDGIMIFSGSINTDANGVPLV